MITYKLELSMSDEDKSLVEYLESLSAEEQQRLVGTSVRNAVKIRTLQAEKVPAPNIQERGSLRRR